MKQQNAPVLISNQPAISYGDVLTKTADIPTRLSDILERAALKSEKGIVYIQSDGSEQFQSYQNLLEDAQRILGGLRKRGLKPQDKVIFQIEPSQDFIPAFWGCILGGFIPVPISIAPTYQQVNNIVNKLHNAWQMLEQPLVLTNRGLAQNVRFLSRLLNLKDFKVETVDNLRNNEPDHNIYKSQPNDLTLLLLTSGSTGMPKAVMLNHRNLLSMSAGTVQMNDFSSQEVTLNWMALDHVGAIVFLGLMAVDLGCQQIQVPTDFILTNPLKWLELIERHRVSISWAPNFAFSLLNERAQEINQRLWDLSSMGFLVNAGEQIVAKTARNFLKLLQTHGLPSHALRPAFGMSETCSGITWSSGFSLDNSSDEMSFVELGGPIPGASLRIVDENNQIVTEGTIGRFQVKGPSVTEGYYQNPERNREVFSDDGWFNTGDMGYLQDGHLILTGRDKDDIIINGINFYSHEIEAVVEEIEQIEISYTAACAVVMPGDNSDKLAIFFVSLIEDQDFLKALIKQIRGRVVQKVGISPNYLIPVKKEAIPKTAIGKIQRQQLTQRFQAGEFDPIIKKLDIAHDNILQDWLYQIEWRQKIETLTVDLTMRANEQWLILADNQGIGLQLSQLLQNQGAFYTLVRPGKAYQQIDEQTLNIDHTNPEHFQQLLETVSSKPARWRGIVHCWSLDTVVTDQLTREDLEAAGRLGCGSLLYLVQALDKANFSEPPSLWLVTQGAMPVAFSNSDVKGQTIINIAQSPLSGLGKVIALEHPELNCVQIDLDPKTKGEAQVLFDEINLKSQETQMAFRQNARYVPRLIHYHPKEIDDKIDNLFHADSTYLITGGLGDLGLRLALWMVEQGVQHLVLTGRRGASDEAQLMLNQWQLAGVHILVIQADVSDPDEVAKILEKTKISMPPLRGIIHAAGIQDDGLLQQQTWERFSQVMAPKVAGTWNLHLLTQEIPLDFFVCFSSMVSLLGSPAQGSYVVANTFMDAVAHHRRALGLPCLSINWGPWAEVGMAAKLGKPAQRRLTAQGVGRISIDEGIAILRKCMGQQVAQIGVLPINWYLFLPQFFQGIQSPFLEAFTSPPSVANAKQLLNQVRNAVSHEERYTLLVDYLRLQVAKSLGMSQPDIQQPLNQLGLDSLIAVELRNAIRTQLGVELTIGTFLTGASVSKLATEIELQLAATENQANQSQKSIDNSTETYPLSHGQRALWFLYQLAPESAAYNINYVARLRPDLELQALQQAFDKLVERHAILRTIYTTRDGEPVQQVHKAQQIHFKVTEANNWSQEELTQWLDEEADRPFNLEQGPVLRIELLLGFSELPILSLTMHHIVADFWSFEILINELESLYQAIKSKSRISLPPLKWSYKDYVQWETERLAGPRGKPLWAYWEKQLGGELPVLNLPTDHPRPPVQTYNGTTATFDIEESINQQIIEFSKVTGSTPYMFMLAVFQILLRRYTGQEDILIGTPMSGRHTTELQEIMGYFVNTVILRHQLHGNPTFEELLQMVRQQVVEALDHQEYPFGLLVEQLQPIRDPSRSPLYQVAFVWDKERHQDTSNRNASKLVTEILSAEQRGAAFDLSLTFFEQAGHLRGEWTYNTELFEESTINRFTGHLKTLVAGALAHPQQRLSQLPLLTEADQQQLLSWNDTATDYPTDKTIVDLFEEQVEKTPNNIAVVFEQQKLTYQQLNEQANQLAHHLLALKQQAALPDNLLIAIAVERSCDMVIGLLGILKAGGAYVPIDPSYPVARIQYMLEDSRTPVLLTQSHLKTQLPVLAHNCVTVCLDDREFAHQLTVNPTVKRQVTDLAYVIYTSGSTGMPKGCQVTHANVARLFASTEAWYQFNQQDVWTLFHSYAFDFSVWEIWGALFYGAKLVVVPHETSRSPADFYQLLIEQQVTVLNQTPSAFGQLIHQDEQPDKLALRLVIFGGEALDINQLQPWFTRHGEKQPQLVNMYGITETTVHVTYYPLVQPHSYNQSIIGIPLPDLGIWVVDKHNQPLPVGVPGEMLVGGAGVTNGYLNRPELTREKFIEVELFGKTKRIYKTGDLARWLPNGHLEYLGRIDHQVKLRGFRIELGEIEAVLTQHEAVKEAVVILYEADENKRLVVYLTVISEPFVLTNNSLITDNCLLITELKDWLKARLPDYMVPSQFMVLEQLPLTQNGKIDRHALPAPSIETTTSTTLLTPTEELLASLWASVLKLKVVSRDNNFFELGGHSLLATQLIARIREVFEVELPVRAVFEEPKLSQLASVIEEASRGLKLPPISRRPADSKKVLSFAQQRLWFLNQFEGQQQSTYNIPAILRLEGDLDINALQNSLSWLLERHESLTSAFPTKDGQAQVQILPLDKIEVLKIHDFTELPTETQRLEVQNRANHHAIEPFDLSQGPLFKADLLLLSATESVLLLNMHHIISDGWSMGVFIREWQHAYTAFAQREQPSLPSLEIQYSDYAAWQRDWLQGEILQQQVDYWREQLAGAPELLELPTDKPRPPQQSYQGAHYSQSLSPTLSQAIKRLSREQGVTLFMTLLTTFEILLSRYSGQTDVCVGSPIANRTHRQTENLIGFLVNTLVLRAQLQPDLSFLELLQQNRQTCLEAYTHQDIPFEMLVEQLQPTRSLSYSPLFQVMLVLQNNEVPDLTLPGLEITALEPDYPISKFDLTLSVNEQDEQLHCFWEYATDLFLASTIERMAKHFEMLLTAILENPEQAISQLPMLTDQEIQQLIAWNDTDTDYPTDKTIVDLFEEQVEKTPNNIAVVFEQQQLTYQQLNEQANQLAHHLLALKQQAALPDNPLIAIAVERSCDMVIGLLGILKAGCAYVPIDPSYPVARIQYMLEDSRTPVLLTQSHLKTQLPVLAHNCVTVCLDDREFAHQLTVNPTVKRQVTDLAYVIYTSGSTGMPKGVMNTHTGIVNRLLWMQETYQLTYQDRILQKTPFSFDVSVWEFFWPLLTGAGLVVAKPSVHKDAAYLVEVIAQYKVTVLHFVPSMLSAFISHASVIECDSLKRVICSGEALSFELMQQFFNRFFSQTIELHNLYGPTEAAVDVSYWPCRLTETETLVPIGKPVANTQLYVLDVNHQIMPIGVLGELCIGGIQVARGYLNRPELTAEKFIEVEIFGKIERIYKTGDLARWLPDGNLEYLGRIDSQVKLRGFRIELGEIETVLSQHEFVKEAVVILYEADENKQLVAYLTLEKAAHDLENIVKDWLRASLPDYMVPSQFMVLEQLPLTPNGKIDRQALPAPSIETSNDTQLLTPTEELLASLWADVLKRETIHREDNFFELGGHSLLATQLIARIREVFEIELPVRAVFEEPKLSQLAYEVEEASREVKLPPISRRPADSKKVLSFAQQRLWFLNQFEEQQQSIYNMPTILRLEGDLDINALQNSLSWLLERHESLTSAFPTKDGQAQVQILPLDKIEVLKIHDFTELPTETQRVEVQNRANHHAIELFDLSQGPLFKADLLLLSATESVLLLNMHHIISDGWSMGVFIREWQHAYTAFAQGEQPSLPPLEIQYSDYAAWQRDWLQGEILQQQVDYWREQLAGVPELLELPTDKPRPPQQSYQGAHYSQSLSPALSEAVKRLSREQGVTLFMTLLTTFEILLSRYSGQTDVCVGSPIANRTHRQTENMIGFLVNTLVLRAQLQPDLSVIDLLRQNRQTSLEAYTHQDIPFEMLVEKLQPTRSLSHSPLFQVMLVLQNNDTTDLTLPGLEITALEPDYPISKFDLTLSVNEQNEQLHCFWEYATDLFLASTIERMAKHFEMLLTAILENPEQAISQLPMLTDQEIQQLIAWNDTATDYPLDKTIVDLFEEQVEKTPANIAVVFEEQQLTYQQLNEQANQLAHYLLALKNQVQMPDNPLIAIAVERSIEMVIGLLGILKAGGAYVPIDPSYPAARIQYMLEDSQAPVLLTQTHLQAQLPVFTHDCVLVCLDDGEFANQPTVNPSFKRQAGDLAYVIYTSGSTGMPKGVMIEHHNLSNLLLSLQQSTFITISDKLLAVTTLSFDIAALELYLPLISGSLLHLVTREMASDGFILQQLLKYNSFMQATPATWKLLMESDWQAQTPLNIFCGGESLPPELANFLLKNSHRLWNVYGPTETTIWSSAYLIQTVSNALVSIGKPIANTHIYILDTQKQPLPPGIPGELCIAGHGLARGYLNRPELTAEKFIEVKIFGKTERIYKTGDLARWLPDGNLEYLGRIDHQVKLRGFRIELGEIETVLTQHEFVKEAVVILYEADENKRLVAYLTIEKAAHDEVAVVKDWLKASLPDYMVPSQFMVLDQLPLTPNGKIDRQALSQLSVDTHSLEKWVAPQTDWEKLLADIWAPVLGVEQVGIHNNFFDLGGHSLQAVQLVSKIALATKIKVSVKQLFLSPTIAQLAKRLEKSVPQPHLIEHNSPVTSQSDNLPVFKGESIVSQSSPYFQLERRSLLSQVLTKKIQPVNAAALGYLPDSILEPTGLNQEQILEQCFENMPVVSNLIDTAWGRIALLLLPRFNSELYGNMNDLVEVTLEALEIAGQMGATTVSLTGIIPSATDYGRAIVKGMADRHLPQITTGHSTTSATVVLTIQKILQAGGRSMARERVGFIGLGSIGFSSLCLMLKCLPHPAELMLCDLYSKKAFLENIREQLVNELGFQGKIQLLFSEVELPKEIYQATLIIGATNVPDVLDISQVQSGTLIVDDSGPHCFNLERAIKRFEEHQDILFTEGGVLKSPQPITETLYFPHHWEKHLPILSEYAIKYNPFEITGCVFSSVLSSYHQLKPTVGLVQLDESVKHFETLKRMDFQAADLHGENYVLPLEAISHFRERFAMS